MAINNRTPALYSKLGFTVKPSVIHSWQLFKSLNKCIGLNKRTKYYASIPSLLFRESSCQCHHHRVSTRFGHQPQKGGRQLKTDTWPCDLRNRNQVPLPTETTCITRLLPLHVTSVFIVKGERRWGGIYPGEVELLKIICLVSTLESE